MAFKFKVGDKVRIGADDNPFKALNNVDTGDEGVVTGLGGIATPDQGAVVTNKKFESGVPAYGEHGVWFEDEDLELV